MRALPHALGRVVTRPAPVVCSCGKAFDWMTRPLVGTQWDGEELLDLRYCPHCRSTRAVRVLTSEDLPTDSALRVTHAQLAMMTAGGKR